MSVRAASHQQICLNQLQQTSKPICSCGGGTSRYICYTCLRSAVMSLCSYPTNGPVSTIAPDHQACMLQLYLTSSHVFIICLLSACLLQFHLISIHVYYICNRQSTMSVTIAFDHLPCLSQLHSPAVMSFKLFPARMLV